MSGGWPSACLARSALLLTATWGWALTSSEGVGGTQGGVDPYAAAAAAAAAAADAAPAIIAVDATNASDVLAAHDFTVIHFTRRWCSDCSRVHAAVDQAVQAAAPELEVTVGFAEADVGEDW